MFEFVHRFVEPELQFGNDAQLMAHTIAEFETKIFAVGLHQLHQFGLPIGGKDAQKDACQTQVGGYAHLGNGNQPCR